MAAPARVITHGNGPVLHDWRFHRSVSGPDEAEFTAQNCNSMDTYKPGDQVEGYEMLRIVDTTPRLVPGSQWDITCRARGLLSGTSRVISRQLGTDTQGWDTLRERRMEAVSAVVPQFGTPHSTHPQLFFLSGGQDDSMDIGDGSSNWVQRDRNYSGIANGSYKRIKRKITTNESITSHDEITVNLQGGWSSPQKGSVSIPRVVVEDTILTTVPPPTTAIPGNFNPPFAPSVRVLTIDDSLDPTYNWPNGWKLNSINSEELFLGAGVYLQTLVYEYVWLKTI